MAASPACLVSSEQTRSSKIKASWPSAGESNSLLHRIRDSDVPDIAAGTSESWHHPAAGRRMPVARARLPASLVTMVLRDYNAATDSVHHPGPGAQAGRPAGPTIRPRLPLPPRPA